MLYSDCHVVHRAEQVIFDSLELGKLLHQGNKTQKKPNLMQSLLFLLRSVFNGFLFLLIEFLWNAFETS